MTHRANKCGGLIAVLLTAAAAHADSVISNGGFQQGLTNWSTFTTSNGTLGTGEPQAVAFSPDNANTYNAVKFEVGQVVQTSGVDMEGGGILQFVTLPGGMVNIQANIAAQGGTSTNLFGGYAQLLIDMQPVAGYDFGMLQQGQIKTATFTVDELVQSGQHSLGIEYWRPAGSDTTTTPYQYVYNFNATTGFDASVDAPEPSTIGLLLLGLAALAMRGRTRLGRSARPRHS
jgi:hypothetical protein